MNKFRLLYTLEIESVYNFTFALVCKMLFLSNKSPKNPRERLVSVLNPEVAYELFNI